jgi:hypothetical protein
MKSDARHVWSSPSPASTSPRRATDFKLLERKLLLAISRQRFAFCRQGDCYFAKMDIGFWSRARRKKMAPACVAPEPFSLSPTGNAKLRSEGSKV